MSLYHGGNYRPGDHRKRWPAALRMTPSARTVALVVLVAGSILFTAYSLGRTLGSADHAPAESSAAHAGTGRTTPAAAPRTPKVTRTTPKTTERYAEPPQLPPELGGPFGSRITTGSSRVALTFDDGPSPEYTPQILALLRQYQIKATFCMIGTNVQAHPDLVREVVAEGHTLCNHSWAHDVTLGTRSAAAIRSDLIATDDAIHAAAPGAIVRYFRQPGGAWTPAVVEVARELGMTSLAWQVDPRDWTRPGAGNIVASVLSATDAGSIVLMHDGGGERQGTVDALHLILANLTQRFELEPLPTGLAAAAYQPAPAPRPGRS
jgi:peptidoglycan/xylan/chitin deacetylase (PgdA/CDA1 family)